MEKVRNYDRQRRANEMTDETAERRSRHAAQQARIRANETVEQTTRSRAEDAVRIAYARAQKQKSSGEKAALNVVDKRCLNITSVR